MGADQNLDWRRTAASALEWWRDAGVDVLVGDDPFDWLAPDVAVAAVGPAHSVASAVIAEAQPAAEAMPGDPAAFLAWRVGTGAPEAGWGMTQVVATGPVEADLMILVDCPEREDGESLLGGAAGRLFDRMLAAIGRTRADVHLASVCTARPIAGRMPPELAARLGEIAKHHAGLAGARRLLVLGDAASRAILSANVMEARHRLHVLNHDGGKKTEVVASFHPRMLMERPALKAEAWKDLQMLTAGMSGGHK